MIYTYTLHNSVKQFRVKISPLKSKVMSFNKQVSIRSETVIDNSTLEQVNTFTYFGCKISYKEEKEVTSNVSKCLQILRTVNISKFSPKTISSESI
jgi:hypothetical protein